MGWLIETAFLSDVYLFDEGQNSLFWYLFGMERIP